MGAGFHGKSDLKQSIKADMWRKYVVPRFYFGLEVHNIMKKDIQQLEAFQKRLLLWFILICYHIYSFACCMTLWPL